jgi:hypothetical protein
VHAIQWAGLVKAQSSEASVRVAPLTGLLVPVLQSARFCVVCLGRDTLPINGALNTVFNVVVRSDDLKVIYGDL